MMQERETNTMEPNFDEISGLLEKERELQSVERYFPAVYRNQREFDQNFQALQDFQKELLANPGQPASKDDLARALDFIWKLTTCESVLTESIREMNATLARGSAEETPT